MASTMMLHLWYSAFLPSSLMQSLQSKVFPVIQNFLKSKSSESSVSLEGTWSHNKATLSAMLPREEWEKVLSYFRGTSNISFDDAVAVRKSVTLAPSRRDYVDRAIFRLPPSWRLCQQKFRGDGVLLPFGASRESFMVPNPTFFQDNPSWPMPDSADPLDGWKLSEVLQATYPAKNDLYGQLYLHIRQDLLKFCQRLTTLKLSIYALQVNAVQLPGHISRLRGGKQLYDRIGLANIADRAYLGAVDTLSTFGPLLKPKTQNPKATLLTLFLNATHEMCTLADQKASFTRSIGTLQKFLPINPQTILKGNTLSAESLAFMNAYSMFIDGDTIFNRFVNVAGLKKLGDSLGLGMKSTQTIVAKWPMRLNENPTQREFEMLYWSGHVGSERYVEWHRTR
ncbi:hypothetical protein PRK78_002142 [Emydomyces testavorans]|uniref:Uncharacterized protein n=1 Tax=Emydomyces testavorans TaxID=2070801 RepID=A0AAF0DDS1_9EURO|nr:hypothetical protein PRK78_002142 [Emydomyces testavorans]